MQTKSTRGRRIYSYFTNIYIYLGFTKKHFLTIQKLKKLKLLQNFFKNLKFSKFSKIRTICCRLISGYIACQISGWYTCFWRTYSPKTVSLMASFIQTAIWSISIHRTVKNNISGILRPNWFRNTYFFVQKYQFENLTFCDPGLTWSFFSIVDFLGSNCKMASIFELCVQKCLKMCRMPEKKILNLVTFRDLLWPDLDPDPNLVWHLCSQRFFSSPLMLLWVSFEQKQSILPVLGFIIQKYQNLTFDLTLTRNLRSILKSYICFGKNS